MLKGQAKKDYQREYMREYQRKRRSKEALFRPNVKTLEILDKAMAETTGIDRGSFAQYVDADGSPVYEE